MLAVVAALKVKPGMENEFDHFRTPGRKMGEFMGGRPEVRLREVE